MPPQVKPKISLHTKLKQTSNNHESCTIQLNIIYYLYVPIWPFSWLSCSCLGLISEVVNVYLHTFCIGWVYEYPYENTLQEKFVIPTPTTTSILIHSALRKYSSIKVLVVILTHIAMDLTGLMKPLQHSIFLLVF